MNFITKMSNKVKVIILVGYGLLTLVLTLLIITSSLKPSIFKKYKEICEDEHITVNVRLLESRTAKPFGTEGYESSEYSLYTFITKKTSKAIVSKVGVIATYVSGDGTRKWGEYFTSTTNISANNTTYSVASKINSSNLLVKTLTLSGDELIKKDLEPADIYVKVIYTIQTEEGTFANQEINYKTNIKKISDEKFNDFEERKILETSGYVENTGEPFDVSIKKDLTDASTNNNSVAYDSFYTQIYLKNANLSGESIRNIQINVYGKINNAKVNENDFFSPYVRFVSYNGMLNGSTIPTINTSIDERYDIQTIFVSAEIYYKSGLKEKVHYKINVSDLLNR